MAAKKTVTSKSAALAGHKSSVQKTRGSASSSKFAASTAKRTPPGRAQGASVQSPEKKSAGASGSLAASVKEPKRAAGQPAAAKASVGKLTDSRPLTAQASAGKQAPRKSAVTQPVSPERLQQPPSTPGFTRKPRIDHEKLRREAEARAKAEAKETAQKARAAQRQAKAHAEAWREAEKEAERQARHEERERLRLAKEAEAQAKESQKLAEQQRREKEAQLKLIELSLRKAEREAEKASRLEQAMFDRLRKEEAKQAKLREAETAKREAQAQKEEAQRLREEQARQERQAALQKGETKARASELGRALEELAKKYPQARAYHRLQSSWLHCFSRRTDVELSLEASPGGLELAELLRFANQEPLALLLFYREQGPLQFSWRLKGAAPIASDPQVHSEAQVFSEAQARNTVQFHGRLCLPGPGAGSFLPAPEPGEEDQGVLRLGRYLQEGAQCAYLGHYGPSLPGEDLPARPVDTGALKVLEASSIPLYTSRKELLALLESQGLSTKDARELLEFMGDAYRLLFHETATEEGRRRAALRQKAIASGDVVSRSCLLGLNSGPVVDKQEFAALLTGHQEFLLQGGGGGHYRLEVEFGLPRATYSKAKWNERRARLACLNLTGLKLSALELSFADLTGVRAEKGQFQRSVLQGACAAYALLNGANFQGADLRGMNFSRANLKGADFRRANLTEVGFEGADLSSANFAGATVAHTRFGGANVRGIKY